MDWMYLFYFSLALLIFFGARSAGKGAWNEEYTSLKQTRALQGITALGIALHHMAQKTCAPWLPRGLIVNGLNVFLSMGYMLVAVFLFCSGLGLYKSYKTKPDYLKGFFRRRILPVVVAFYLSEWLYTVIRLLSGERMDLTKVLWYLSGLHMANVNSWYAIVIPFFYLAFWAAFRFCKKEGLAIFWVFLFTLAYTVLGSLIDHQDDWWMRGEWWYNSIILFPLGLLFAKYEEKITRFFRKGYWIWLILSFAAIFALYQLTQYMQANGIGYYGEWGINMLKVPHRLMSAASEWLVSIAYVLFCFLLMMKVKLGNRALAGLGAITLEFYLIHGLFVDLFGYSFLDSGRSILYIKSVPLYIAAVLAASIPASLLFRFLRKNILRWMNEMRMSGDEKAALKRKRLKESRARKEAVVSRTRIIRRLFFPLLFVLMIVGMFLLRPNGLDRTYGHIRVTPPEGYTLSFSDSRYATWKFTGEGKKPGNIVFDGGIRGEHAQGFASAEAVLRDCDWMTELEIYTNPQGIRMARGYSTKFSDYRERRYYVESDDGVFLLSMIEDPRYFNEEDCEEVMQQTADTLRRK